MFFPSQQLLFLLCCRLIIISGYIKILAVTNNSFLFSTCIWYKYSVSLYWDWIKIYCKSHVFDSHPSFDVNTDHKGAKKSAKLNKIIKASNKHNGWSKMYTNNYLQFIRIIYTAKNRNFTKLLRKALYLDVKQTRNELKVWKKRE